VQGVGEQVVQDVELDEPVVHAQDEELFEAPTAASASPPPLALYRRYRPDTFADVIGQDHVTEPLQRALTNNRVNHAYLFSGPRGCGKTTSARILARCLNCEKGPIAVPCGQCQSCRDLARGGPGSIDVIEIDAASHGGVDDARELRERAFFAPVASRYKIYIVDEAHMVTTAGFNALLKLVEEPPPHVKFIFATTEPDKVIGTIRSRTHHYPFRLVPPRLLTDYLGKLCAAEGIAVEPAVLPLVVRAGAGSVRDSLSVLDQLLGAADENGVAYRQATSLLGYTPDSLLDEFVDAFVAGDAGGVFSCVDKVIEVGQDPRRFAEDLLRRLRDLVVVAAVPDALTSGLVEAAPDQAERLSSQAASLGPGELTRAAEVIATGLTEMRGTTAPRLHLELMCARVLLPGADVDDRGVHARLDRLERRIGVTGGPAPTPAAPQPQAELVEAQPAPDDQRGPAGGESDDTTLGAEPPVPADSSPGAALTVTDVRRLWPEILEEVKGKRRFTWILLSQNAQVAELRNNTLLLAMSNAGARDSFGRGGSEDVLREAIVVVLGADFKIETLVDPGGSGGVPTGMNTAPGGSGSVPPGLDRAPGSGSAAPARTPPAAEPPPASTDPTPNSGEARDLARQGIRPTRSDRGSTQTGPDERDAMASRDDTELDDADTSPRELLTRHLGAEIIAEDQPGA
jgi:DNA polymerase-3 subunit gamma/tau